MEDIRNNLQLQIAATISSDFKTVEQAVNEGKLVRDINRKADVTRDIAGLVAVLAATSRTATEVPAPAAADNRPMSLFAGWFGRS
jgi:Flp pilus assembly CpaE family ATPase